MPRISLTDKTIRALKSEKYQDDFWDVHAPGLGVRVTASGKKTFFCRYRLGKSQRRMSLGEFPALGLSEARKKLRLVLNRVDDGHDPQVEKTSQRLAESVGDLFETFFSDREGRISAETLKRYKGIYRREFEESLATLKASDLRKAHVIPILRSLSSRAQTQCERAEELLQACFNHAVALDLIEFNPLHRLPRFGRTRIGERHLSPEEVAAYLQVVEKFPIVERIYFYLLLFYGSRPGELSKWRWDWIKKDRIVVPANYQKNGKTLILPLTSAVEKYLTELHSQTSNTQWLFPNPQTTTARASFRRSKIRLDQESNFAKPWSLRDIRRTTETLLRELGTSAEIVSGTLNHNTSQLRKIYDKSENLVGKRNALVRYEKYLSQLQSDQEASKPVLLAFAQGA